jgi:hypothetical protein
MIASARSPDHCYEQELRHRRVAGLTVSPAACLRLRLPAFAAVVDARRQQGPAPARGQRLHRHGESALAQSVAHESCIPGLTRFPKPTSVIPFAFAVAVSF